MKRILLFIIVTVMAGPAFCQTTLLGKSTQNGGFGAPAVRYTEIDSNWGFLMGARGGWIINRRFILGAGLYGIGGGGIRSDERNEFGQRLDYKLTYGGVELEYLVNPGSMIHYSVSGMVGFGGTGFKDTELRRSLDESTFFVFEPGVNVLANITDFFRLGFGVFYRFVSGVDSSAISNDAVSGPSVALTLNFGIF